MNIDNWEQSVEKWKGIFNRLSKTDDEIGEACGFCKEYKQSHPDKRCEKCPLYKDFCGTEYFDLQNSSTLGQCLRHIRIAKTEALSLYDKIMSLKPKPEKTYYVGQHLVRNIFGKEREYVIVKTDCTRTKGGTVTLVDVTNFVVGSCQITTDDYEHITAAEMQKGIGCTLDELAIKEEK